MTFNEYQQLAQRTANPEISPKEKLFNAVLGLCGEVGEVADMYKKFQFQGHDFLVDDFIDELGDVLWYICEGAAAFNISFEDIAARNIEKLKRRYPEGFSSERSINRVAEVERRETYDEPDYYCNCPDVSC